MPRICSFRNAGRDFFLKFGCALLLVLPITVRAEEGADSEKVEDSSSARWLGGTDLLIRELPRGFYLQDTSVYSSALFTAAPGSVRGTSSSDLQTGLGYSLEGGWAKMTPLTIYSVLYSSSFIAYQGSALARDWNQYLTASISRKFSSRLQASSFDRVVLTDNHQFLFGGNLGSEASGHAGSGENTSNLLLAERALLASTGAQLSYDYSPRTTLSFAVEAVHNQALGVASGSARNAAYRSTSGSATATIAYAVSNRQKVDFSVSSTKTASTFESSVFSSFLSSYSYVLGPAWTLKIKGGLDVSSGASARRSGSAQPIGGATLGYSKRSQQVLLSSTQGVVEIYGAGTGVVWSSNASWIYSSPVSHWSFSANGSYDRTNAVAGQRIEGWRGTAVIRRALNRYFSISGQYAYLVNSYRDPSSIQSLDSKGLRFALVWTPTPRGSR